jgi:uncharacterized membrane protein YdjX (TVP38/TMEM64 family)
MTANPTDSSPPANSVLATRLAWALLVALLVATGWSWWTGGIVYDLLRSNLTAADKLARLRQFFAALGPLAPLVYFLLVVAEVLIAPIPGLMLYVPGGVIFGGLLGGALALAGNVVGAGIACTIARSIRPPWLSRALSAPKAAAVQASLERYGGWLIFLLRLNPLTSSDVVSYAAGLTRIAVSTVMLATCAGMAPLCFAQAWLAESLVEALPGLIYPLLIACAIYVVCVALVIRSTFLRSDASDPAAELCDE